MTIKQRAQGFQHLMVVQVDRTCRYNGLNALEQIKRNNGFKRMFLSHPRLGRVLNVLQLQLERGPVVDVVADVFLIR